MYDVFLVYDCFLVPRTSDDIDEKYQIHGDEAQSRYFDDLVEVGIGVLVPAVVLVGPIAADEAFLHPDKLDHRGPRGHQQRRKACEKWAGNCWKTFEKAQQNEQFVEVSGIFSCAKET